MLTKRTSISIAVEAVAILLVALLLADGMRDAVLVFVIGFAACVVGELVASAYRARRQQHA